MKYRSGERIFTIDTVNSTEQDYLKVIDDDTSTEFWLPRFIVDGFTYIFSWDRYKQDLDTESVLKSLNTELNRLENLNKSPNIKIGIKQIEKFIEDLNKKG